MNEVTLIILLVVLLAVAAAGVWLVMRRRRRDELRERFGPEYGRLVREYGNPAEAQSELDKRVKRVEKLDIQPLSAADRERFARSWRDIQVRFVDDPGAAVTEADRTILEVMRLRGYPSDADFDQRVADISVESPAVVSHYRDAREIARRHRDRAATTEDLRRAMVHYRALFTALLDGGEPPAPAEPVKVHEKPAKVRERPAELHEREHEPVGPRR